MSYIVDGILTNAPVSLSKCCFHSFHKGPLLSQASFYYYFRIKAFSSVWLGAIFHGESNTGKLHLEKW